MRELFTRARMNVQIGSLDSLPSPDRKSDKTDKTQEPSDK